MSNSIELIAAMAERSADMIRAWGKQGLDQPLALQPQHLEWMCRRIVEHARDWPAVRLHRWLGFVQGAMIANRIVDLAGAKAMFDGVKNVFGEMGDDLFDHLNPDVTFRFDIGGQG
jgi:hypothetical protein